MLFAVGYACTLPADWLNRCYRVLSVEQSAETRDKGQSKPA
jgi:hypothetical protein